MNHFFYLKILIFLSLLIIGVTVILAKEPRFEEQKCFSAPQAQQGVAVDNKFIYVIGTREIGKYEKETGKFIAEWKEQPNGQIQHLDGGVISGDRLYCAHSNYPDLPMTSSVEIWDTQNLQHVRSHSFGVQWGSCTWIDRFDGFWWAVFAQYDKFQSVLQTDNRWTTLVKLNDEWQQMASWVFPDTILKRMKPMSNSGGSWGPDKLLYCTGHNRQEIYALQLPEKGSILQLQAIIPFNCAGQGIAWDRIFPTRLYGIDREKKEVVISKLIPLRPLLRQGRFQSETAGQEELERFSQIYSNKTEWETRAKQILDGILKGAKLSPLPQRCPLKPIIHSKRIYKGYSVENVAFESLPGFYVSGNLYRPEGMTPPFAAILCPHGHFEAGRFRPDHQLRCATLARMGAVVFAYDLIGWGESIQFENYSYPESHQKFPEAVALQTWNSMRVIDFLLSLKEVDPLRIGVTGASGGGTQTFLVASLDDRIAVSVPVVMVSAHFFGGCNCESGMPIHVSDEHLTNNVEIAALAAPRPQLLVSCGGDWTKNTANVEFPFIQNIYKFYDKENLVENVHFANEGHDYGYTKRIPVYQFMAKHLKLNINNVTSADGIIDEKPVVIENATQMHVFDKDHPWPKSAIKAVKW